MVLVTVVGLSTMLLQKRGKFQDYFYGGTGAAQIFTWDERYGGWKGGSNYSNRGGEDIGELDVIFTRKTLAI